MNSDKATLDDLRIDRGGSATRRTTSARWLMPFIAVLVIFFAGGGLLWRATRVSDKTPADKGGVRMEKAGVASAPSPAGQTAPSRGKTVLNASGYVTARRSATVSSKVTGKVREVLVEEGMKVQAGQVLARLDASNVEASLHLAEAQLLRAKKAMEETKPNLEFAQSEFKRFSGLAATKVVSDSDLRRSEAEAKGLEARLARQVAEIAVAESEVAQWKQQVEDTIIKAPFNGVVTSKNAQPGEMISPMSVGGFTRTGICTVVDMTSLEIEVDVNESHINRVQAGGHVEATLDAYPNWKIPAKVIAIIPTADRQKATVKVRIGFDQLDSRILPEMAVKVAFQGSE